MPGGGSHYATGPHGRHMQVLERLYTDFQDLFEIPNSAGWTAIIATWKGISHMPRIITILQKIRGGLLKQNICNGFDEILPGSSNTWRQCTLLLAFNP